MKCTTCGINDVDSTISGDICHECQPPKMDELKTCPCCGSLASSTSVGVTYDSHTPYFVICIKCNLKTRRYMTSQEAEKVWNTRIEADEWISVDKELPREYQTVLTQHKDDLFPVCAYMMEVNWYREIEGPEDMYNDQSGRHGLLYKPPTHWKPLPKKPPKETP